MIKQIVSSDAKSDSKHNIIKKCLRVLKIMIEESEKKGTARVKSHFGLQKRKIMKFKVTSQTSRVEDCVVRVYGNTTMWDLKEIIANKSKVCVDFIKLQINKEELVNTDHGKTVIDMKMNDGDELKLSLNSLDTLITQVELTNNNEVVPECMAVFNRWYDTYSTDEKMLKEHVAKFLRDVTGSKEMPSLEDPRIQGLFSSYDKSNQGWLEREGFVGFYRDCALKPDKKRTVWENLKAMGVRNDLKMLGDPYQIYNSDPTSLPRYILAHDENLFNTIFYLQDLSDEIAKEAFDFLNVITTNPIIYKQIMFSGKDNKEIKWDSQLDDKNIYKLIYSLQIIESFLEDIEISSENIDSFSNEESILGQSCTLEEIKNIKIDWMKIFISQNGFTYLIKILDKKLEDYSNSIKIKSEGSLMNNICLDLLLRITRIFFSSSLNKFEIYRKISRYINSLSCGGKPAEEKNISENMDLKLVKQSSSKIDQSILEKFFTGELGDKIINSLNYSANSENLLSLLSSLIRLSNRTAEENSILETSFSFLISILGFAPNAEEIEKKLITGENNTDFELISIFGLLNNEKSTRVLFSNSLITLCKACQHNKRFDLLTYLFSYTFKIIRDMAPKQEANSLELFDFFSNLFEIYLSNIKEFELTKSNTNPKDFLTKLIETINSDISDEGTTTLSNELFVGYMKIITKVSEGIPELKQELSEKYNFIQKIMTRVLFKQNSVESTNKINSLNLINPNKYDDSKANRNSNSQLRNVCYSFIISMLRSSIENFEKFFSLNVLDETPVEKEPEKDKKGSSYTSYYHNYGRNEDHVGLRNLGCICYMNSMMQQFFMVPSMRYCLMQADDKRPEENSNTAKVDDNSLHQVQRLYSFLDYSMRMDYNPFGFCYSFKDWDGNPTNTSIQQDSQEFLNRFFDVIEEQVKPTAMKHSIKAAFGGKTCSQVVCADGCGKSSNRFEDFFNLSLEVNHMKTIKDSLDKFVVPDKIDDFMCDTCNKKVTITKRTVLSDLPNVLVIHLQRIFFNYETNRQEKINSRLEFPRQLNLKQYTIEEITRKEKAKKAQESGEEFDPKSIESDEVYFKDDAYYEYNLVGVTVHTGSADSGHYYSYINTIRNGNNNNLNECNYDPNNEKHTSSWLEFNDSNVSKFDVQKLEDECFGGKYEETEQSSSNASAAAGGWNFRSSGERTKSAYLLVYERKIKSQI